ncbi:MAG: EamA family transporter, partial [Chitinophagaceae bacterium]
FLGSGLLDALLNHVQQTHLNSSNSNNFLVLSFGTAGFIGSIILAFSVFIRKQSFDARSILAGIAIGVPNSFSIWCLVRVLEQYAGNSSAIIPINNMGIVLFSSVVASVLFSERLSRINWLGIILSLAAVALIAFG